ncbi:uncharacterized protein, partial [Physcomitrium patens]
KRKRGRERGRGRKRGREWERGGGGGSEGGSGSGGGGGGSRGGGVGGSGGSGEKRGSDNGQRTGASEDKRRRAGERKGGSNEGVSSGCVERAEASEAEGMHAGTDTGSNVMVSGESGGTRGGGAGDSIERPASTPQQHHLEVNESDDTFESDSDSDRKYPNPHSLVECELTEDLDDLDWSWDGISPWLPMCTDETVASLTTSPTRERHMLVPVPNIQAHDVMEHPQKHDVDKNEAGLELAMHSQEPQTQKRSRLDEGASRSFVDINKDIHETRILPRPPERVHSKGLLSIINEKEGKEVEVSLKKSGTISWAKTKGSLEECIKWENVECINGNPNHTFVNALKQENWDDDSLYLESLQSDDDDAELLLKISFLTAVKVYFLIVMSPPEKGPKTLKLFVNRPDMKMRYRPIG